RSAHPGQRPDGTCRGDAGEGAGQDGSDDRGTDAGRDLREPRLPALIRIVSRRRDWSTTQPIRAIRASRQPGWLWTSPPLSHRKTSSSVTIATSTTRASWRAWRLRLESHHVAYGRAALVDAHTAQVTAPDGTTRRLTSEQVLIVTGSVPVTPN